MPTPYAGPALEGRGDVTGLGDILRTKSTDWFFGRIEGAGAPDASVDRAVAPETSYLSVILRSLRVPYSRRGFSRFYGAVTSRCSLPHRSGVPAEFCLVTTPPALKGVEPKHADRVLTLNKRLLGPVPYRGGDLEMELGLLSVKSADLAGPYLEVLETMASVAGVAFLVPALAMARPLQRGIDLLLRTGDPAVLEVGLSATFPTPETGLYCLIAASRQTVDPSGLRLGADSQLLTGDGDPVVDHAYLVFSIDAHPRRDDWSQIPDVREAHEDLVKEVARGDFERVDDAKGAFRRAAVMSPDLLAADGARLAELVSSEVTRALQTMPTGRGTGGPVPGLRPLEAVALYAK